MAASADFFQQASQLLLAKKVVLARRLVAEALTEATYVLSEPNQSIDDRA